MKLGDTLEGEPFIVPLAIPLVAGPSALAVLLLLEQSEAITGRLLLAVTIAWALTAAILLSSTLLYRLGILLVMLAVQMFMNGVADFLR